MLHKEIIDPKIYLPSYYRGIKEVNTYTSAILEVLSYVLDEIINALDNNFVISANKEGVERYEKLLSIIPDETYSLEARKHRIITQLSNIEVFTWNTLEQRISEYSDEYTLTLDGNNLIVAVNITEKGSMEALYHLLYTMLPANIVFKIVNETRVRIDFDMYVATMPVTRGDSHEI